MTIDEAMREVVRGVLLSPDAPPPELPGFGVTVVRDDESGVRRVSVRVERGREYRTACFGMSRPEGS